MEIRKILLLLYLLMLISIASFGQLNANNNDTSRKKENSRKGRNMFGHGIPRELTITSKGLTDGYVMYAVPNSASVYLINRAGQVVHEWKGNYGILNSYLQDDGSLVQIALDPDYPVFYDGAETGRLQKITWDSKVVWDFEYANEETHAHHDLAVLPNGNVLALAWEVRTADEVLLAGRKPELTPKAGLWPEKIVEIKPDGEQGGKIVWEWHLWDHLIQDYDPKKANYGNPADHAELLDVNVGNALPARISKDSMDILVKKGMRYRNQTPDNMGSDAYHFNAINYNAELDQIAVSSFYLNEIFIIDHSTTTKEAGAHQGGRWGKGGDFLYRWGNPANYRRGDSTTQQLFHQHDIRWIEEGKPGAGSLTVFNNDIPNGDSMNYSAVYELSPPTRKKGDYLIENGKPFGPKKPVWTYIAPDSVSFWGSFVSGARRMENGNTFITEGPKGRFFEVTKNGKIVWEYLNHYRGGIRKPNGDPNPVMPMTYWTFRSTFIPANHPGLKNRKLEPLNPQPRIFVII